MGKQFEGREAGRTQEGGGAGVCTLMHRKDPFVKKNEVGQVFIVTSASERTASRKCFFLSRCSMAKNFKKYEYELKVKYKSVLRIGCVNAHFTRQKCCFFSLRLLRGR